jgi:flagellar hook-length control protein FliK
VTQANHASIVSGVHGQLLPGGGTMQIRLDPPELGTVQVTVHMKDGVMTAQFETSNDDATKMLSRSLGQLKTALESGGVSVEKLTVQQSSSKDDTGAGKKESSSSSDSGGGPAGGQQQQQSRNEQQRKDLMDRMWRKLSGAGDPVDMVA